ncbi:MAG: AhpC/TSA family protein [Sphingobacteriales bacterium]|nr:AhpC/TSA family protein [Sphingobacteriales bacterium]
MTIKNCLLIIVSALLFSCNNKSKDQFTINGKIENAKNQRVYLEQLFFNGKDIAVIDTAEIKNGKFVLTANIEEEGLYRIRLEQDNNASYLIINDQPEIDFSAKIGNGSDDNFKNLKVETPGNKALKTLIVGLMENVATLEKNGAILDSLQNAGNDSLLAIESVKQAKLNEGLTSFLNGYVFNSEDPIVTIFAMANAQTEDKNTIQKRVDHLSKKFPKHKGVQEIILAYNKFLTEMNKPKPTEQQKPVVGNIAPDFTMNDTEGNPVSLSQYKGQYVLVDFWASWCVPCRGENPNVVAAYKKYKNKNFTVLGVSFDEDKDAWMNAIQKDGLTWKHISDLKGWQSAVVPVYGIEGIPYNVLLDPEGKILATELRDKDLDAFLSKTLK